MTKTYALKRLLEHGPMNVPEMVACTGWGRRTVEKTLDNLKAHQLIRPRQRAADRAHGLSYEAVINQGA
jgi:hypothetical protein